MRPTRSAAIRSPSTSEGVSPSAVSARSKTRLAARPGSNVPSTSRACVSTGAGGAVLMNASSVAA